MSEVTTRAPAEAPNSSGLSHRFRQAREHAGLSQRALAAKARCTNSTIIQVEAGNRKPQIDTIEIFARAMGVSAGWLAYGEGIPPDWFKEETKES